MKLDRKQIEDGTSPTWHILELAQLPEDLRGLQLPKRQGLLGLV